MRVIGMKKSVERDLPKSFHNKAEMPKSFSRKFNVEKKEIESQSIWIISPLKNKSNKTVLYVHGGAYIYGLSKQYWSLIEKMILSTNATFIIPDYPLTPENTAADAHAFMQKVYDLLAAKKIFLR